MSESTLNPQPYGHYEGHDLSRSDWPTVWSVGKTPKEAIEAFCQARMGGPMESLGESLGSDDDSTWGYRFLVDGGTGCKAAGIYVPGGVILTWWK